jgi:hypothetical protein
MKKYEVTIKAIIIKTYTIEAESEAEALATGNDLFSVENDEAPEHYEQNVVDVSEVQEEPETETGDDLAQFYGPSVRI